MVCLTVAIGSIVVELILLGDRKTLPLSAEHLRKIDKRNAEADFKHSPNQWATAGTLRCIPACEYPT
ncbi:TPA: DUF2897 family protein [Pseudomonas putida]|nr:DUF2897 family protein [Pseudomonas putida]